MTWWLLTGRKGRFFAIRSRVVEVLADGTLEPLPGFPVHGDGNGGCRRGGRHDAGDAADEATDTDAGAGVEVVTGDAGAWRRSRGVDGDRAVTGREDGGGACRGRWDGGPRVRERDERRGFGGAVRLLGVKWRGRNRC